MNERIRELRDALGLTMEKFGVILGVKKAAINKLEKGENNVTDQMFKSICREFSVNEEWLRDGTGEMFYIPEDETAALVSNLLFEPNDEVYSVILDVIRVYEQLQPDSKAVLKDFCKKLSETRKNRED